MATLVGTQTDLNSLLEQLIELDFDAIDAYDAAIERLESQAFRSQLGDFRADHVRHTQELGAVLRQSGREPPTGPDIKRMLASGKVVIAGLVGDRAVLVAMKTNEDDTNTAYERAVNNSVVPSQVKGILQRGLSDERRHRAWIEQQIAAMK
jgi:uncharacterized protein (TIGR02284 family)